MKDIMKSINIKGQRYKIKILNNFEERFNSNWEGLCDKENKVIYLSSKLKPKALKLALLHEICHSIIHETGIDQAINGDVEEIICENISTSFFKAFF